MGDSIPPEYAPRLCHVVKWPEFQGYGFNLHAEKGKAGQFIGKVDDNSPAEASGLRDGDRIVEVNGTNIGNENHQQVVSRIKSGGEETKMLVVSPEADSWFKEQKRVIKGDLPEVQFQSAARNVQVEEEETVEEPPAPVVQESVPEPVPEPEPEVVTAPVNGINGDLDHRPRLCHLKLWPTFQGYGFNLHAERDKPGQYIGLVDDNSPASTAGLRVHDRIVEVNGVNIEQSTHQEVIGKIKEVVGETRLLVVDRETDLYYREKGVVISSSMEHTQHIASPDGNEAPVTEAVNGEPEPAEEAAPLQEPVEEPVVAELEQALEETPAETQEVEEEPVPEPEPEPVVLVAEPDPEPEPEPVIQEPVPEPEPVVPEPVSEPEPVVTEPEVEGLNSVKSPTPPPEPEYIAPAPVKTEVTKPKQQITTQPLRSNEPDILGGGLSVAEMKERLRQKKKPDPRLAKMSFEQKYKDFQKL